MAGMRQALLGAVAGLAFLMGTARAEDEPDYINTIGKWEVAGFIKQNGAMAICRMLTKTEDGLSFAYVVGIGAGGGQIMVKTMFVYPAAVDEMLTLPVSVTFDGKNRTHLKAGITSGYVHAEFPSDSAAMQRTVNMFQKSKVLTIVSGLGTKASTLRVKLDDSTAAFDTNGMCLKEMLGKAVERMKAATQ